MRYFEVRKPRIEIIPMIDIMLFLLVFFVMITLKMIPMSGHITKLPTSSTAANIPRPKLAVEIVDEQVVIVDGVRMSPAQLTHLLKSRDAANTAVTIMGNHHVSLQSVMSVVDAIKNGGASQIALATSVAKSSR